MPITMEKKKPVPKKVYSHKEKPLFLRLPAPYHQALEALAKKGRRTLTAEAMIALEEYFAKHGVWPPPDDAQPG